MHRFVVKPCVVSGPMKRLVGSPPESLKMADGGESSSEEAPQSAPTAPTLPGGAGVLRVLLAEDEQFQRDAFAALFSAANKRLREKLKFELTLVSCADEVLSSIRETTDWQLVLLDINMPGTSGAEIIADVRAALGDRVPVLMISGAADMGAVHNCLQQGADLFMAKPLYVNVIENLWQHVLKKDPMWFDRQTHVDWSAAAKETSSGPEDDPGACKQQ